MNTNPALVLGLAQQYVERQNKTQHPLDAQVLQVRIYTCGQAYVYADKRAPARWYVREANDAPFCRIAPTELVQAAIDARGAVQITGYRCCPLATFADFGAFEAAVSA